MIEQQPVPGIMRDGSTPAATRSSSRFKRSSIDREFASLFVPNTASPQFCDSSHLQCAMKRLLSGARPALNGVTTGASTPRMPWIMIFRGTNEYRRTSDFQIHAFESLVFFLLRSTISNTIISADEATFGFPSTNGRRSETAATASKPQSAAVLWLIPVMMRTPMSVSAVESVGTVEPEPRRVIAVGRMDDDDANRWRRSIEDWARWWRRVVVSRRWSVVRLNHLGAGVQARSTPKPECEHRQCSHKNFLSHSRIFLLLFGRLNPTIIVRLLKNRRPRGIRSRHVLCTAAVIRCREGYGGRSAVGDRRYNSKLLFLQERQERFVTSAFHVFFWNEMEGSRVDDVTLSSRRFRVGENIAKVCVASLGVDLRALHIV